MKWKQLKLTQRKLAQWKLAQWRLARSLGFGRILACLAISGAAVAPAQALEWRFCIAPASQEHRIYMTLPFPTTIPMEEMENGFHQILEHAGRRHDSVQCPTGANEQAVQAMRQHAGDFNRQMGNEVVGIDWRPAPAGR